MSTSEYCDSKEVVIFNETVKGCVQRVQSASWLYPYQLDSSEPLSRDSKYIIKDFRRTGDAPGWLRLASQPIDRLQLRLMAGINLATKYRQWEEDQGRKWFSRCNHGFRQKVLASYNEYLSHLFQDYLTDAVQSNLGLGSDDGN
ncbi:hypothetical protein M422DRAFT_269231 [Sphaerobolus stellatus SS14]|uniref:Uncharacterized protein n=1 Tax=Sphaerobolus stellatus (strain SS14) TaxID=990650 RepID=A0A0C9TIN2_SPHS4|nr:hypothetical protein M422DRAFT_269231 [Sphaerobolus stellatus SS14]